MDIVNTLIIDNRQARVDWKRLIMDGQEDMEANLLEIEQILLQFQICRWMSINLEVRWIQRMSLNWTI